MKRAVVQNDRGLRSAREDVTDVAARCLTSVGKRSSQEFQPVVEFTATQSSLYIPLKNNIDSDTYFVTRDKPAFFSFESM